MQQNTLLKLLFKLTCTFFNQQLTSASSLKVVWFQTSRLFGFELWKFWLIRFFCHCVKSVQIRSYFWSGYREKRTKKTPYLDTFHAVCVNLLYYSEYFNDVNFSELLTRKCLCHLIFPVQQLIIFLIVTIFELLTWKILHTKFKSSRAINSVLFAKQNCFELLAQEITSKCFTWLFHSGFLSLVNLKMT